MDSLTKLLFPDPPPYRLPHNGFSEEAPEEVVWPNGSYVKPVPIQDRRNFRGMMLRLTQAYILLATFTVWMAFASEDSKQYTFRDYLSPRAPHFWFLLLMAATIFVFFYHGALTKVYMIWSVWRRPNRLFQPGWNSILIAFEDVKSFEKFKLAADDFGLLKIVPEGFLLEMQSFRAFFRREDVTLSVYTKKIKVQKNSPASAIPADPNAIKPLILRCRHPEWTWECTLCASIQSLFPLANFSSVKRRNKLLRQIEAITGIPPPANSLEYTESPGKADAPCPSLTTKHSIARGRKPAGASRRRPRK